MSLHQLKRLKHKACDDTTETTVIPWYLKLFIVITFAYSVYGLFTGQPIGCKNCEWNLTIRSLENSWEDRLLYLIVSIVSWNLIRGIFFSTPSFFMRLFIQWLESKNTDKK